MPFNDSFTVDGKTIGTGQSVYLIAEIGRNHNGDLELAKKSIDAAVKAGADAVKLQSLQAKHLLRKELTSVAHVAQASGGKSIYELTCEVELSEEVHRRLSDYARSKGITFFSTPEDHEMVALLERIDVPLYKIASLDIVYLDLIEAIAATGKPVILSTGMAYLSEIERALTTLEKQGVTNVALLQCTSNYPPLDEDINLNVIPALRHAFGVPVGFSDHSFGIGASIASVALGACVIERHFTLDHKLAGVDHHISLNPEQFRQMADEVRTVEKALGSPVKRPVPAEAEMRRLHRRRLVAARPIRIGKTFERDDVACKCSEEGFEPEYLSFVIGRKAKVAFNEDDPINFENVD